MNTKHTLCNVALVSHLILVRVVRTSRVTRVIRVTLYWRLLGILGLYVLWVKLFYFFTQFCLESPLLFCKRYIFTTLYGGRKMRMSRMKTRKEEAGKEGERYVRASVCVYVCGSVCSTRVTPCSCPPPTTHRTLSFPPIFPSILRPSLRPMFSVSCALYDSST